MKKKIDIVPYNNLWPKIFDISSKEIKNILKLLWLHYLAAQDMLCHLIIPFTCPSFIHLFFAPF